jgi:hypothetical protein
LNGFCVSFAATNLYAYFCSLVIVLFHVQRGNPLKLKPEKLLDELKSLAESLGVQVIIDKGNFSGGHCLVYEERKIVLNKLLPTEVKAAKLAQSLTTFPLDNVELKPVLRQYLETEKQRLASRTNALVSSETQEIVREVLA